MSRRSLPLALLSALFLLLVLPVTACKSEPREATDKELAPVDQDPDAATPGFGEQPAPGRHPVRGRVAAPPPGEADAKAPPVAQGPILTILYVAQIRLGERERPALVVFSSDPECPYLAERPRPSRVLKPLEGPKIARLLGDLREAGLDTLPAQGQKLDETVDGERQIIVIRDGTRTCYRKETCRPQAELWKAFARCEAVLVRYSHEADPFTATEGVTLPDAQPPR